jgi:membrane-associated protease RseP (regulator of RpoE activity)
MLTDSPWAKAVSARVWRFSTGNGSTTLSRPETFSATVRWESALPVRLALRKVGLSPAVTADYTRSVVVVVSLPKQLFDQPGIRPGARTKPEASLTPTGSSPLSPLDFRSLEQDDNQPLLAFTFAKTPDLLEPRELRLPFILHRDMKKLHFHARFGDWEVDQEFPSRDMTFMGKPER